MTSSRARPRSASRAAGASCSIRTRSRSAARTASSTTGRRRDRNRAPAPQDGWEVERQRRGRRFLVVGRHVGPMSSAATRMSATARYIRYFGVTAEQAATARFLEGYGGEVGRNDQFYSLAVRPLQRWKVNAFYDEIPQRLLDRRTDRCGTAIGLGNLTLAAPHARRLASADDTQANIRAALATTPRLRARDHAQDRRACASTWNLDETWKLYASYAEREAQGLAALRRGLRRRRWRWQHRHHRIDRLQHARLPRRRAVQRSRCRASTCSCSASFFRNGIDTMTFRIRCSSRSTASTGVSADDLHRRAASTSTPTTSTTR